jgi:serine/threonine-protein kinase
VVAILIAAFAAAGWYVYEQVQDRLTEAEPVPVPNVVGLKQERAVDLIEQAELSADVKRRADEQVPSGTVIEQSPQPGTRISKGEAVTVVVSSGVPKVEVPDVVGQDVGDAVQLLNDQGLRAERREVFSDQPPGTVLRQNPEAGAQVEKGAVVTLRVSKGVQTVGVPNVVGLDQASAEAALTDAGFTPVATVVASDQEAGIVVDQSPDAETDAQKGAQVEIFVSEGPQTVAVPGVVGLDEGSATAALQNQGFGVDVQDFTTTDPAQDGLVLDQSPGPDTQADPGTTVTIVVGRFEEPPPPPETTTTDTVIDTTTVASEGG